MPTQRSIAVITCLCTTVATHAVAQRSSFITTLGRDTLSFEQYDRVGDVITGDWVTTYGGIMYHHYTITLRSDGSVAQYALTLHRVNGKPEGSVDLRFDGDSLFVTSSGDSTIVRRVSAPKGTTPVFANTVAPLEVIVARARASGHDSSIAGAIQAFGP